MIEMMVVGMKWAWRRSA